ncbi:hypothetical protein [Prolixibacter sp. SD074]|uniref:hypothetical protein n=1 Tax=Prolixibacter sp. SD074 TaxID=2652391 RepID=UPI0012723360|nr:hypothetical protein [Prolixibacter sp. SD074]GET29749.1 hypothetical protein SD074_19510 [Prolixibacter sp. SD074]
MKKSKSLRLLLVLVFAISLFTVKMQKQNVEIRNETIVNTDAFYGLSLLMKDNSREADALWNGVGLGVSALFGIGSFGAGLVIAG